MHLLNLSSVTKFNHCISKVLD